MLIPDRPGAAIARAAARVPTTILVLGFAALVGVVTYVALQLMPAAGGLLAACTDCNVTGRDDVLAAVTAAGGSVGPYAAKSTFEKFLGGKFGSSGPIPVFKVLKIIHIGSAETEEEAARRAMDVYKDMIMVKGMPEGSTGADLEDAIDRFTDFATGGADVDGPDDDGL